MTGSSSPREREDDPDSGVSRRHVLALAGLALGLGAVGAPLADLVTGSQAAGAAKRSGDLGTAGLAARPISHDPGAWHPRLPAAPRPAATTGAVTGPSRHAAAAAAHRPHWVSTWHNPVSSLDDFLRRSPSTRFPRRAIMLTIDDGPDPEWTPLYLRLLAKHHVRATFNVIGIQVRKYPKLVRAAVTEGHHVANHTFHHPLNLPYLSATKIRHEMEYTTDLIVRATGFRPRQFRAPGGVWGPDVFAEASRQGMLPLGWDIDPRDWALPGVAEIRSAMLAARPHDIILCHDGGGNRSETYAALKTVIPALLARGYTFVMLPAPEHI